MSNLVRLLVELATDDDVRSRFRADPEPALDELVEQTPYGLTGEDVEAAAEVARHRLGPELAERLRTDEVPGTTPDEAPTQAARRHLLVWCESAAAATDATEATDPGSGSARPDAAVVGLRIPAGDGDDAASRAPIGGQALPTGPPGSDRHLWAVTAEDDPDQRAIDPEHPAAHGPPDDHRRSSLTPVPEPEGGFRFSVLEVVVLPDGVPSADIEAGAEATVVAVHDDPEPGYEVEVSDVDGGRRWLGVVPPDAVARR